MAGATLDLEYGRWTIPGHRLNIEYALSVLEQLRIDSIDGLNKVPHGGIEIGGVLFGVRGGDRVRILASRSIACEYALGPSFVLSEKDQAGLREMLEASRKDPDLKGMEPVGWYHAHTRSGVCLTERNLELYNRFFPEPWQIALVIRPANFSPTTAGFFFHEPDGKIHAESSYLEFTVAPLSRVEKEPERQDIAIATSAPEPEPEPPEPERETLAPITKKRRSNFWIAAAASLLLAGIGLAGFKANLVDASAINVLPIWSRWHPARPAPVSIDPGKLRIRQLEMEAELLRRKSDELAAQNNRLEEMVSTLQNQKTVEAAQAIVTEKRVPLRPPATEALPRSTTRQQTVASREQLTPARAAPPPRLARLDFPVTRNRTTAPPLIAPPPAMPVSSPPVSISKIVPASPVLPASIPQPRSAVATPVSAATTPPAQQPVHNVPKSGRLIWTGKLPKNGKLMIQGRTTSSGSLNGELPGRPVHVTVYPADLSSDGLVLYSSNLKYAKTAVEPPGQQNGWNRTLYTWDPHHSQALSVNEAPGPRNDWNRIVLQSRNSAFSVIVIDWAAQ